jgi:hypothetical protein
MTRLEIASCCTLVAFAALSTSAAAAPGKKPKPGATPAASATPPAATSSAPPPAPAPPPSAAPANASDEESASVAPTTGGSDKKLRVGADLLFVLPIGNLSNVSGPQIGPLLDVGYRLIPQLELTGRIGYLFAFGTTQNIGGTNVNTSVTNIPVWLGARYFLNEAPAGLYGAAEIGMNFLTAQASATISGQGQSQSTGDTRAGFNLGVGYVISKDLPIDFRLQYSYFNLIGAGSGEGAIWGFGLSAGYSFFF